MKIQIASLAALERLLGNDTELEIDIRNSVVQAFATKHLKAVVNTDTMAKVTSMVKKEINEKFLENVKLGSGSYYKLTPDLIEKINAGITNQIVKLINERIDSLLSTSIEIENLKRRLNNKLEEVEKKFDSHSEKAYQKVIEAAVKIETEISNKVLENKIDKMVNDRIKEKLGI